MRQVTQLSPGEFLYVGYVGTDGVYNEVQLCAGHVIEVQPILGEIHASPAKPEATWTGRIEE
jgi:hypothetical protein